MTGYKWPLMQNTITWSDRVKLAKFILTTNKFTQGPKVEEFEKQWCQWLGASYSLFVSSGSTANFLLVDACMELFKIPPGSKVIVPMVTWVTNINPIIQLGLQPIFVDVNLSDFSYDIGALNLARKEHGDSIKMVFTTHLLGFPAPVEQYKKIFPGAVFIDDVCESHGCIDNYGNKIGSKSTGATFSFYFGHHMSTIEGGMISTDNFELYDIMKMKRSHGLARTSLHFSQYKEQNPSINPQFLFMNSGYNFRNTEIAATLGLSQLPRLDGYIANRREMYSKFVKIINHTNKFKPMKVNEGNSSFCFPFVAKSVKTRDRLIELFEENSIEYRPIVGGNLLKQPYLKGKYIGYAMDSNADIIHKNGVYIGNNQFIRKSNMKLLGKIMEQL